VLRRAVILGDIFQEEIATYETGNSLTKKYTTYISKKIFASTPRQKLRTKQNPSAGMQKLLARMRTGIID
jgi:hypothetical protein